MSFRNIVIYVSGKYSGTPNEINENIQLARNASIQLWELGFTVITPHLNTIHFENDCKCSYEDYMDGDLEILSRCDAILFLENFKDSNGALKEKEKAEELHIPRFYKVNDVLQMKTHMRSPYV
jgi:Domain of unknown function (DUF4406)